MLFSNRIKELRENQKLLQRHLAAELEIDTPMYSKIERGERPAKRAQVIILANMLSIDENELLTLWLADKLIEIINNEKEITERLLEIVKEQINLKQYGNK